MNQIWINAAERSGGENTPESFEMAAYRLMTEQVIYHSDRASKVAYWLIDRFEREFQQVFDPFGVSIQVNRQLRYAYALPRHAKMWTATVGQTLLALVLRGVYDEAARSGNLNDDGEATCELVELEEKYRLTTQRELPMRGELEGILRTLKRWGIARKDDSSPDDDTSAGDAAQPYVITIRPAIADVLGEAALQRLSHWTATAKAAPSEITASSNEGVASEEAGHVES